MKMENDEKIGFAEACAEYFKRFGRMPIPSPDGGPSAEEIMHAALTGIDLDEGKSTNDEEDIW